MIITQEQQEQLKKIAEKHKLKLAVIFGSRANNKGNPREDSDLDIAFSSLGKSQNDTYYYGNLFNDLSDIFQGYNVDLLDLKNVDYFVKYEVCNNSQLIIGDPLYYYEFRAKAHRMYEDSYDLRKLNDILLRKKHQLLKKKIYG